MKNVEEILDECKDLVEEVCVKFGYDSQDTEGNKSLKTVLLEIIPIMLKDSKKEERDLFYQMLSHTPIVITENLTQESYDKLLEQYIGKSINSHIIEEDIDLGEYGNNLGAGAYVAEPILDEDMNLQGKKSFIYIQKVNGKAKELFGTDINVSHLIHELGHAWHAEKEQFVMQDDGTLKERVGTGEFIYTFAQNQDNKFIKKCTKVTGLMIEESMNTIEEETAMANYLGISLEEMKKVYREILIPSNYQGYMADFVRYMLQELGKDEFENYRLYGETESKDKINEQMQKTEYWINRESDILSTSDSPRNYDRKREILARIDSVRVQDFFKQYESVYFPDISEMTPFEKIDNVLEQKYNMNMIRYSMGIDNYTDFIDRLGYEGYSLVNQTAGLLKAKKEQENLVDTGDRVEITPSAAAKNALAQGTTTEQVYQANCMEHLDQTIEQVK